MNKGKFKGFCLIDLTDGSVFSNGFDGKYNMHNFFDSQRAYSFAKQTVSGVCLIGQLTLDSNWTIILPRKYKPLGSCVKASDSITFAKNIKSKYLESCNVGSADEFSNNQSNSDSIDLKCESENKDFEILSAGELGDSFVDTVCFNETVGKHFSVESKEEENMFSTCVDIFANIHYSIEALLEYTKTSTASYNNFDKVVNSDIENIDLDDEKEILELFDKISTVRKKRAVLKKFNPASKKFIDNLTTLDSRICTYKSILYKGLKYKPSTVVAHRYKFNGENDLENLHRFLACEYGELLVCADSTILAYTPSATVFKREFSFNKVSKLSLQEVLMTGVLDKDLYTSNLDRKNLDSLLDYVFKSITVFNKFKTNLENTVATFAKSRDALLHRIQLFDNIDFKDELGASNYKLLIMHTFKNLLEKNNIYNLILEAINNFCSDDLTKDIIKDIYKSVGVTQKSYEERAFENFHIYNIEEEALVSLGLVDKFKQQYNCFDSYKCYNKCYSKYKGSSASVVKPSDSFDDLNNSSDNLNNSSDDLNNSSDNLNSATSESSKCTELLLFDYGTKQIPKQIGSSVMFKVPETIKSRNRFKLLAPLIRKYETYELNKETGIVVLKNRKAK